MQGQAICGRRGHIEVAGDDERRRLDAAHIGAQVCIPEGCAATDVPGWRNRFHYGTWILNLLRLRGKKFSSKPARHGYLCKLLHARRANESDAIVPCFRAENAGRGICKDESLEASWLVNCQPDGRDAAQRQPAKVDGIEIQVIEEMNQVAGQLRNRVGRLGNAALPVAARVVAQHAKALRQRRHCLIPHVQIGAERVGEDKRRSVRGPVESVVKRDRAKLSRWHRDDPEEGALADEGLRIRFESEGVGKLLHLRAHVDMPGSNKDSAVAAFHFLDDLIEAVSDVIPDKLL